jgi:hypothetical protein
MARHSDREGGIAHARDRLLVRHSSSSRVRLLEVKTSTDAATSYDVRFFDRVPTRGIVEGRTAA